MSMTVREVTIAQRKAMAFGMFSYWRDRLGLNHWDLEFSLDVPEPLLKDKATVEKSKDFYGHDFWGWCIMPFAGEFARIYILDSMLDKDELRLETLIVHELLHCVVHSIDEFVENSIDRFIDLAKVRKFLWEKEYDRHSEILVDHLALSYVRLRQSLANDQVWDWTIYA